MTASNGLPCVRCGTSEWNQWNSCKECARRKTHQWKLANPEKKKENDRRWQIENKDRVNQRNTKWRLANYQKNLEIVRVSSRQWRFNNPEKQRASCLRWNRAHPESAVVYENQRRARKAGSKETFTVEEWLALCERYDNQCLACGRTGMKLTADHVVPLSKGGCNGISNIQPLCQTCNSKKCTHTIDYRKELI